jgi:hypothetical protein
MKPTWKEESSDTYEFIISFEFLNPTASKNTH